MASTLELTLVFLVAAVAGVVVCRLARLPPMLGYLAVGVALGPTAMGVASDAAGVEYLAAFGIVFLMFVIGLEFNLPKLQSMRKLVFGLGLSQVVLTILAALAANAALVSLFAASGSHWGLGWQSAIALGAALAMSSTAFVVKLMAERLEMDSEHGKRVMGVLLFQDLAVVPLLVLIPALGSTPGGAAARTRGGGAEGDGPARRAAGRWACRHALVADARRAQEERGGSSSSTCCWSRSALAWLTQMAGLSLALGAFIAGILIAETEFKHQVETDIRPFHDVLLGLFFITIGMKLDLGVVFAHWPIVLALAVLPVVFKFALVTVLARAFAAAPGVALRTGLYLAQAGEFGFVLLGLAGERHLLPPEMQGPVLASMVLSMLATPLIFMASNRIVMRLSANDWLLQSVAMTTIARRAINAESHNIICGFGRSGQNLARLLEAEKIAYIALDLDPDRVRQAAAAGQSVVFGDAARLQSLMAAGLARASAVVVSYHDTPSALKILHLVHSHAPRVPVVVRTIDDADFERLRAAGATEVVPEAIEGSLMLASHALALVGVPMRRVLRVVQQQRDARYGLLRGFFHGADDDTVAELDQARLLSVTLPASSGNGHRTLGEQALPALGVSVVSLRRASGAVLQPSDSLALAVGDTLVLSGLPERLARAEAALLTPGRSGAGLAAPDPR